MPIVKGKLCLLISVRTLPLLRSKHNISSTCLNHHILRTHPHLFFSFNGAFILTFHTSWLEAPLSFLKSTMLNYSWFMISINSTPHTCSHTNVSVLQHYKFFDIRYWDDISYNCIKIFTLTPCCKKTWTLY